MDCRGAPAALPGGVAIEYGPELTDILLARPLGARVIADVLWNGLWQRARAAEPSTILGLASMLVILTGFVMSGATLWRDAWTVLQPSSTTFPTVTVTFLATGFYVLLLAGCGCWTYLRHGGKPSRCGVAAMSMSLIAGIPIMVVGLLMVFGLVDVMPSTRHDAARMRPFAWAILVAPLSSSAGGLDLGSDRRSDWESLARRRQPPATRRPYSALSVTSGSIRAARRAGR